MTGLTRRQFLKLTGAAAAGVTLFGAGCTAQPTKTTGRREPP
ncbi:MAG: twin-arginine translocation signal domain-containing protein, partial [Anaerolineae bacterium]|nr:twin-arginine translocation signal domain-containing protein [Anaerolineae bacterium]